MLKTAASDHPFDWEVHLRPLCMAYNISVNPTTEYSPFYLMFGRNAQMPVDLMYGASPSDTQPDTVKSTTEFAFELQKSTSRCLHPRTNPDGTQARLSEATLWTAL